jgi:hypothetical protein
VSVRQPVAKALVGAVVLAMALLVVGLTASTDSAFSIAVHPVFLRLGVDVDVKVGSLHLHAAFAALDRDGSTKSTGDSF